MASGASPSSSTPGPANVQLVNDMWNSIQTLMRNTYSDYHLMYVDAQNAFDTAQDGQKQTNHESSDLPQLKEDLISKLKNELESLESGQALVSQLISMVGASQGSQTATESPEASTSAASKSNRKRKRTEESKKPVPKRTRGGDLSTTLVVPERPTISVGTQIAFRLRKTKFSEEEWIQCEVTKVLSDVRFEVQDPEPDENNNPGQSYKASIRDIIVIPLGADLSELPVFAPGTIVLARYPETTTFYRAEVIDGERRDGKCRLKFEGEEEEGKETDVNRHLVLAAPK